MADLWDITRLDLSQRPKKTNSRAPKGAWNLKKEKAMYISKIDLDTKNLETTKAINNPGVFHSALERSFSGERQHPLWRIDKLGRNLTMIVISKDAPDFTEFLARFGGQAQTREYDKFLEKGFKNGDFLRFHAVANPTICHQGQRIPLNSKSTENQPYSAADWMKDRLEKHGVRVADCRVTAFDTKSVSGKEKKFHYVQATYDGFVQVLDSQKLVELLSNGVGHEKAYGCGLVSVMQA